MIAMPFTYSISHGIALAFVSYAAIKICTGKIDSTSPAIWVIAILSVISFAVAYKLNSLKKRAALESPFLVLVFFLYIFNYYFFVNFKWLDYPRISF